jgi:outer membrane protein
MMNKVSKIAMALTLMFCLGLMKVSAQKIGYVDLQEIMTLMPEYKKANTDMESFSKSLEDELKKMSDEFQKKYADFEKNAAKLPEAIKEVKQKELQDMQGRIQEFQQSAQENARKKEAELLKPIIEKAKTAIGAVAKESGYGYVMDSNTAGFLYKPESDNLSGLVKKKLGLQ